MRCSLNPRPLPLASWGEAFPRLYDRLVHHATILALKGDSYRLRGKDLDARPAANPLENA